MLYQKLKMSVTKISQLLAYLAGVLAINLLAPLSASAATVNVVGNTGHQLWLCY